MGRLIDADRLKAHYCWWAGGSKEMSIDEAKKTFDTIIDLQPPADEYITPQKFAEEMRELANDWDEETGHICADDLMVKVLNQLGYGEGTEIFEGMSKWYS